MISTKEQFNEILAASISKRKDLFETMSFIRKCRDDEELKDACYYLDKNSIKNIKIWKKIISFILKDIFIANELKKLRNTTFGIMFVKSMPRLSVAELKRIIKNSGNHWMTMEHTKIGIFRDYCDKFLQEGTICEQLCSVLSEDDQASEMIIKEYHAKREQLISTLDDLYNQSLEEYKQKELFRLQVVTGNQKKLHISDDDAAERVEQYNKSLNDSTLLQE